MQWICKAGEKGGQYFCLQCCAGGWHQGGPGHTCKCSTQTVHLFFCANWYASTSGHQCPEIESKIFVDLVQKKKREKGWGLWQNGCWSGGGWCIWVLLLRAWCYVQVQSVDGEEGESDEWTSDKEVCIGLCGVRRRSGDEFSLDICVSGSLAALWKQGSKESSCMEWGPMRRPYTPWNIITQQARQVSLLHSTNIILKTFVSVCSTFYFCVFYYTYVPILGVLVWR